jgi:gliding motility-associated-like protein
VNKRIFPSFIFFCLCCIALFGQHPWKANPFEQKVFIENKGQFNESAEEAERVLFQAVSGGVKINFTKQGVVYHYNEIISRKEEKRKAGEDEESAKVIPHSLSLEWIGSNPEVEVVASDKVPFFYTYPFDPKKQTEGIKASAYKKIIYRNIYPYIDAEYILPEDKTGVKYSLILHPGADASNIRMKWNGKKIYEDASGNMIIQSSFPEGTPSSGNFTDHAPKTFYADNHESIPSAFFLKDGIVSFSLSTSSHPASNSTIIIDPWTKSPTFTTNNACDVNYDNAGNVYAYGSSNPCQLVKFNSAGVLQWVFNATSLMPVFPAYYGDFAVDAKSGSCYVGNGYPGSLIAKVNTNTGVQVALYPGNGTMSEIWRMDYNYCSGTIVGAGGSNTGFPPGTAFILDTNLVTITPVPISNIQHVDVSLLAVDKYSNNSAFMLFAKYGNNPTWDNALVKCPLPGFVPAGWSTLTTHTFGELFSVTYAGFGVGATNAMNGIAVSPGFVYTYDGSIIKKWNKTSGAFISSLTVSPTLFTWGGLDVDACDNLYVGVQNAIKVYDASWNFIATYAMTGNVYDLHLDKTKIYACGAGFVSEIDITTPPCNQSVINLSTASTSSSCGGSNGTATVIPVGGNPPFTYVWNPTGQTTSTATGLSAGTYTVTVNDSGTGCSPGSSQTATVIVTGLGTFSITASPTNINCNGGNNGSANVITAGGTSPYTYSWNPTGATTSSVTGLSAGTYSIIVTDATGCSSTQTVTITQPAAITTTITASTASCGVTDGSATANSSGGTGAYIYNWNPSGQTTQTATGLGAGSYTVIITDANGCTKTAVANISNTGQPIANIAPIVNVNCNGGNNGSATVNVTVGTPNYTYLWSNGQTTSSVSGLTAGNYQINITDANGCIAILTATIAEPTALTASVSSTPVSCNGGNNGSAVATASGGTPSYSYLWNPGGQTTSAASGLTFGNYSVTITDSNGCTQTATVAATQPGPFTSGIIATGNACNSGSTGSAAVSASGGTGPYSYNWNPSGQSTQTANGLPPGNYTATVTDSHGCTSAATATVSNTVVTAVIGPTASICPGTSTSLAASGGTNYLWNTGSTGSVIAVTPASTSTYSVIVSNGNCSDTASATVTVLAPPNATAASNATITAGVQTTLSATGGGTYSWSPSTDLSCTNCANPVASPQQTTEYCVYITDAAGCTDSACVIVTVDFPCEPIFIPNAFSPNNDGENDSLFVYGSCIKEMKLIIYNRWGEKVYEGTDPKQGWDGMYRGKPENAAVFDYYLTYTLSNGNEGAKKGNVSLVR